jgi:ubiquitin-protein ligase
MIQFACPGCGREFHVPEKFAGKKARCRKCGAEVLVQAAPKVPAKVAPAPIPVRTRRLMADLRQMREVFAGGTLIRLLDAEDEAGEVYRIEYNLRGVESLKSKQPVFREQHIVEIRLTRDYPRLAPACQMLTPIFHPNIDESSICVGDHWTAGERLTDLTLRIGEMIAYQAYNIKSPLNGEAAMWADLNPEDLPTDNRDLYPLLERAG